MPDPSMPQQLLNVAFYHQAPGRHPMPQRSRPTLHRVEVVTDGRGWVEHDGQWVEVTPGDMLWHMAGDYTIGRSDFENPYCCLSVGFKVKPNAPRPVPRFSRWPAVDEVRALTSQLVRCFVDERFDRQALLHYTYARLRFQAQLDHWQSPEPGLPGGLLRVLEAIDHHYDEPLRMEDLAETAGWSIAHLHAMTRRHLDRSPHQMLIERRIRVARERLTASDTSVKQIAMSCGFSSAASFCRRFREVTGLTPNGYRQKYGGHPARHKSP